MPDRADHVRTLKFSQEGGLLQVFELPSVAEMKAGVEICCHYSSNTCFMSGDEEDQFTLTHFTGEFDYVIGSQWMAANQVHVVGSGVQTALQNSSCDLLVDMAQVILCEKCKSFYFEAVMCRTCNIVLTYYPIWRRLAAVSLVRELKSPWRLFVI